MSLGRHTKDIYLQGVDGSRVRCEAVFPGDSTPVLMLRADCSLFALITTSQERQGFLQQILHRDAKHQVTLFGKVISECGYHFLLTLD